MEEILKRLELIKTSIALEEEELITLQTQKLQTLNIDEQVKHILNLINNKHYQHVIQLIEQYKQDNSGLIRYIDPQIQGLKLELKALENQLQQLSEQKADYILEIDEFNYQYTLKVAPTIQKLLNLKKTILQQKILVKEELFKTTKQAYEDYKTEVEQTQKHAEKLKQTLDEIEDDLSDEYYQAYKDYEEIKQTLHQQEETLNEKRNQAKAAKDELEEDPIYQEYQETKQDYQNFEHEYQSFIAEDSYNLDKEQQQKLKTAYRKACRLCHPDIVADELKDKAHKIMSELNAAKKKNDLARIEEILAALESGESFGVASDTVDDKEILTIKIAEAKQKIEQLKHEIAELDNSESYQLIQQIDDKESYFEELKKQLEEEYQRLEEELKQLKQQAENTTVANDNNISSMTEEDWKKFLNEPINNNEDDYWTEEF